MQQLEGGFYTLPVPFVTGKDSPHQFTPSGDVLAAANALQAVPWAVNPYTLRVLQEALATSARVGGLPADDPEAIPLASAEQYAAMGETERQAFRQMRRLIQERNDLQQRDRWRVSRIAAMAGEFAPEPAIYFTHQCDWRGRYFAVAEDLNPQGHDLAKGLLMFATSKPLDAMGARRLAIGLANSFGHDKVSLEERVAWVKQNRELILDSVNDPLDGERFWCEADAPWLFLALAHDYARGVTQVPVSIDATCSGLQHLATLSGDPVVASSVNVLPTGQRQDIYGEVAAAVAQDVTMRALQGDSMAAVWAGNVTRKTLKPACMKLAYGQTTISRRDDLMEFAVPIAGNSAYQASRWLAYRIEEALKDRVFGPMMVMAYLSQMARTIARAKQPVTWTTPTDARIVQGYAKPGRFRVDTLAGRIQYLEPGNPGKGADSRAAARAMAPNYVHSMDAAHLTAIVNAFGRPVTAVHDCVGTYAGEVGELAQTCRDTFAELYAVDRLAEFDAQQREQHPELVAEMPLLPPRGTLDVQAVRRSEYFFS